MENQGKRITPKNRFWLTVFMLAIPFLFFLLLELFLRLIGYSNYPPLVKKEVRFGKEKYVVNSEVARRYFSLKDELIPEAADETFAIEKPKNVYRIFCLGGSTTAGFPYEINVPFPFQLKSRLSWELMDLRPEVVNLGISAVNSYSVLDLLPEVLEHEPDLIIIYMGHNEFYGAFGVGSSQYLGTNGTLILLYLKLKRLRFVQLLGDLIGWIDNLFSGQGKTPSGTLMAKMISDQSINIHSDKFRAACENFQKNLTAIVRRTRQKNVQVILSTLVSNLKDHEPFVSGFAKNTDESTRRKWEALFLQARSYQEAGEQDEALQQFNKAALLDSLPARLHFYRAKSLLVVGDTLEALKEFEKARDLDRLRFRAPGVFNEIIKKVGKNEGIPVLDMEEIFRAASPDGIPGKELFLEHLHPNFDGYRLIAQSFMEAMRTLQVINPPKKITGEEKLLPPKKIDYTVKNFRKDSSGVTKLDLEFGNLRNFFLTRKWPFPEQPTDLNLYQPVGSQITAKIALAHIQKEMYWDEAHYQLAQYYEQQKQFRKAYREYLAVYLPFQENYFPAMKIGDLYAAQEEYGEANYWYNKAVQADSLNPALFAKFGQNLVFDAKFHVALKYLNKSLQLDSTMQSFSGEQKAAIHYFLGLSYANLKNWKIANRNINQSLQLNPAFEPARKLRNEIKGYLSKESTAK